MKGLYILEASRGVILNKPRNTLQSDPSAADPSSLPPGPPQRSAPGSFLRSPFLTPLLPNHPTGKSSFQDVDPARGGLLPSTSRAFCLLVCPLNLGVSSPDPLPFPDTLIHTSAGPSLPPHTSAPSACGGELSPPHSAQGRGGR